jgi:hypothetical protein
VDSGQWTRGSGQWKGAVDSRQWTVDSGQWTVGSGLWTVRWAVNSKQWEICTEQWAVGRQLTVSSGPCVKFLFAIFGTFIKYSLYFASKYSLEAKIRFWENSFCMY